MCEQETIAAIATAPGEGGISIIRLSGPDSFAIADRVFRCPKPPLAERPTHTIVHGYINDHGRDVDEVLALVMRAPRTYTGEDVVEFQGHGGSMSARRILRCVLEAGARLAEPGEFTRRAFLNGRLDLVQAEAVLDLVRACSDRAANIAIDQIKGSLSKALKECYDSLISISSDLAASFDFPEEDINTQFITNLIPNIYEVEKKIDLLLQTSIEGRFIRNGAIVVISGLSNVGKSTLLNSLLNYNRSIVSPIPGTTRDFIEERICLNGLLIRLVDTAGIRQTGCSVELEGIRRTKELIEKADLQLYVIDSSRPISSDDLSHLASASKEKLIVVLNKADLGLKVTKECLVGYDVVITSLLEKQGLDTLRSLISSKIDPEKRSHLNEQIEHVAVSERHRKLLVDASAEIKKARAILHLGMEDEIFLASELIKSAAESVGLIIGRNYRDDLLDEIFSRFCIGK